MMQKQVFILLLLATCALTSTNMGFEAMMADSTAADANMLQDTGDKPAAKAPIAAPAAPPVDSKAVKVKAASVTTAPAPAPVQPVASKKLLTQSKMVTPPAPVVTVKAPGMKDTSTKAAGTKPKQQLTPAAAVDPKAVAQPAATAEPKVEEPNLDVQKAKLKDLNGELEGMRSRLKKIEAKDLEIRKDKIAEEKDFDSVHQAAFQKIHKEIFSMVKDAYQIGEMAKNIVEAKSRIEDIMRSPWVPRPLNGKKPVGKKNHVVLVKVGPAIPSPLLKQNKAEQKAPITSAPVPVKPIKVAEVKPLVVKAEVKPQTDAKKVVVGKSVMVEGTVNNVTANKAPVPAPVAKVVPNKMNPLQAKFDKDEKRRAAIVADMHAFKKQIPKAVKAAAGPKDSAVVKNPGQAMVAEKMQPATKVVALAQSKAKAQSDDSYSEVLADMKDEELFGKAAAQIQSFEMGGLDDEDSYA